MSLDQIRDVYHKECVKTAFLKGLVIGGISIGILALVVFLFIK